MNGKGYIIFMAAALFVASFWIGYLTRIYTEPKPDPHPVVPYFNGVDDCVRFYVDSNGIGRPPNNVRYCYGEIIRADSQSFNWIVGGKEFSGYGMLTGIRIEADTTNGGNTLSPMAGAIP